MLQRILTCALLAGFGTGILLSGLYGVLTAPLIAHAEVYETHSRAVAVTASTHEHHHTDNAAAYTENAVDHHHEGGAPQGWSRMALTLLATTVSTIGFALMLVAANVLAYGEISIWSGLGFGLAGFAATGLATSLGLAPELPGGAGADLVLRQAWWIGTAGFTAAGIAVLVFAPRLSLKLPGLVLLVAPHLVGVPGGEATISAVPAELAALFAARSIVLQGVMWVVLGLACSWIWQQQARRLGNTAPV